ncbi:hypothetical protein HRbin17_02204 [bacterium HR17]|uniref:RNA-binding protein KhpB n=1 Tax=Candidatus Fervidibacter japonicus TaxID=2035412 RepID=A0A2H5XES6_9BACT|nr:hypothetical protein HRbin17_02204 [bacterium HR17]
MRSVEVMGKSVEDAVQQALQQLGVTREQVDIEILSQGTAGIFGVGGEPARVRVTVKDSPAAFIKALLTAIVQAAGWDVTVQEPEDREGEIYINMEGSDVGLIVGKHGSHLEALQLLVNAAVARKWSNPVRVVLDAGKYRERRRAAIVQLALNAAERARTQKRPVRLRYLTASERRIVHLTLQSDPTVFTISEGEGADRVVIVAPIELRQRLLRPNRSRLPGRPSSRTPSQSEEGATPSGDNAQ